MGVNLGGDTCRVNKKYVCFFSPIIQKKDDLSCDVLLSKCKKQLKKAQGALTVLN